MIESLEPRRGPHKVGSRIKPLLQILEVYDRDSGKGVGPPIAHLLLEREQSTRLDERDGSVYEATIELRYQRILGTFDIRRRSIYQVGNFVGFYSKLHGRVSLTSCEVYGGGGVFLNLTGLDGQRIATYMLNEIITWAKQWPEAEVKTITLNASDASPNNKLRRNRLYEQFNIAFDYDQGSDGASGRSRAMLADELKTVDTWALNIVERQMLDYVAELVQDRVDTRADLAARDRAVQELSALHGKASKHPLRWAAWTLLARGWQRLASLVIVGIAFSGLWMALRDLAA
ncbi:hypothetical protein [Variovorax sp. LjRoot178]|uniref:hypothetical protein n=1 Tax=Variovorax sp. LjRoot178 TaxID=3342277 RepID=UPI003ECD8979